MTENSTSVSAHAISATRRAYKELVDGTLRVQFDIDPMFKNDFLKLFPEIDMYAAIAPLNQPKPATGKNYGQFAKALYMSQFCMTPEVWQLLGTDEEYRAWIQDQNCITCSTKDYNSDTGEEKCEAAHVRRAGSSGTGFKAEYMCVPLCHEHHHLQHQHGESVVGGANYMMSQRNLLVKQWAWEKLKEALNVTTMKDTDPQVIVDWATENNVQAFLP